MKKIPKSFQILFTFIGLIVVLITGLISFVEWKGAGLLNQKIQEAIATECPTCHFQSENTEISLFSSPHLKFSKITFVTKKPQGTNVDVQIDQLEAQLEFTPLLSHEIIFDLIEVEKPTIVLIDNDTLSPPSEKTDSSSWFFQVSKTNIKNGRFKYERDTHGTHANLKIHKINAELEAIDSTLNLKQPLLARLSGQIEKSGNIDLNVSMKSLKKPLMIDVDLKAENQNLEDLTPFFEENAGVILNGTLIRGRSVAKMRHDSVSATVSAEYQDLTVALVKNYVRNEVSVFFSNLAANVVMAKKNQDKSLKDQTSEVTALPQAGESIVGFFLRGMKEAALKVTRQ